MTIRRMLLLPFFSLAVVILTFCPASSETVDKEADEIKKGTIKGTFLVRKGVPLSFGQAMFYDVTLGPPPKPEKYERTPDISKTLDAEGRFSLDLPAGRYFLGAIRRVSGDRLGPPQVGDYVYRSMDKDGTPKEYVVKADSTLDTGTFSGAFPLTDEDFLKRKITTAIKGKLMSMQWKPVKDAVVLAFAKPNVGNKPLFVSDKTDKDGYYVLPLVEGTYYLRVRNSFVAGPPQPGQIVGYYGEGTPAAIKIKNNEIIEGVNFQVIVFPGRGPFSGTPPPKKGDSEPE